MSGLSAGVSTAIGGSGLESTLGGWGAHVAHGVAQGTLSVLQGGKFGAGFAAGFMGHGARNLGARLGFGVPGDSEGLMGRTVVVAMVGGLSSKITGGTFANGAVTAAFVHLFNAEGGGGEGNSGNNQLLSGSRGLFKDLFRYALYQDSLAGEYGEFVQEDALKSKMMIDAALQAYIDDAHFIVNGVVHSFRSDVHTAFFQYIAENKTFLFGRQATQEIMVGLISRYTGKVIGGTMGGSMAYSGVYGAALNAYDNGASGVELVSRALIGSQF